MSLRTPFIAVFLATSALGGCVVREYSEPATVQSEGTVEETTTVEVQEAPPPPREETIVIAQRPTPQHVWVHGYWAWHGRYEWVPGHWHRAPQMGHVWVAGHWQRNAYGRYVFVQGHWQAG